MSDKKAPKAKKKNHEMTMFGDVRKDPYYWFRDRSSDEFKYYLGEENRYTWSMMSDRIKFIGDLYKEMKGREEKEDNGDESVAVRRRPNYSHHRSLMSEKAVEFNHMPLDLDFGSMLEEKDWDTDFDEPLDYGSKLEEKTEDNDFDEPPDYGSKLQRVEVKDFDGNEIYTISIFYADAELPAETLVGVTNNFAWATKQALVYIARDETQRAHKACLHKLGTKQESDTCIYHEEDNKFSLDLRVSESKKFLFVTSASKTTSFNFYLDVSNPEDGLKVLTPRVDGIDTSVSHRRNHFFILRRTAEFFNSEVIARPLNINAVTNVLEHRESVKIQDIQLFEDHLVVYERENGLPKVTIYGLSDVGEPVQSLQGGFTVRFDEPTYSVEALEVEFSSSDLRFLYSSLKTPPSVYNIDMKTGNKVLEKSVTVLGGFDASNYVTERKWANAEDGTQIPISIVYRRDHVKLDGSAPLLLTGYGSYEICEDPSFEASRLSLLDRGFIYAIAHVRGGGEMGRQWYENGKLLQKKNSFTDFIACAEYLIENKYCSKEKLCIIGASAGGLLIGVVLNMRPDLFKAAVAQVPFVDVLTTMMDPTIPLTTTEWEEWGDPQKEEFYHYMKSYSPVDNVKAQNYPNILVTTGFNDSRVMCSEPAKFVAKLRDQKPANFVAKLRDLKTDNNLLLFKCNYEVGHFLQSRDARLGEEAFQYAFIMKSLNMIPVGAKYNNYGNNKEIN